MRYGFVNWYPWRNTYWETKWGAYSGDAQHEPCKLLAYFDTAWSPPAPVVKELAELYPEIKIEHKFLDEGYNYGGVIEYEKGAVTSEFDATDVTKFAQEEFGHEP